jgi:hypothetical protein
MRLELKSHEGQKIPMLKPRDSDLGTGVLPQSDIETSRVRHHNIDRPEHGSITLGRVISRLKVAAASSSVRVGEEVDGCVSK